MSQSVWCFGGALNLNVHFHSLVLDGVFTRSRPTAAPVFHALPAPTDAEVAELLDQVYRRVRRLLRRRGRWPEEAASASDPLAEQLPLLVDGGDRGKGWRGREEAVVRGDEGVDVGFLGHRESTPSLTRRSESGLLVSQCPRDHDALLSAVIPETLTADGHLPAMRA